MKVAHFAEFAPHRAGLYMTAKDLILAERQQGIDAAFIDANVQKNKVVSRPAKDLKDGDLKIVDPDWAKDADILVRHSIIHPELENRGIPVVMAIHGRPESSFLLEHRRVMAIYTQFYERIKDHRYKAYFTFWKEYMFHNSLMIPEDKLYYIPAMVDLKEYTPEGNAHVFPGKPSILVVDMWRQDTTPYNVLLAAAMFQKRYCPEAKINVLGIIPTKKSTNTLFKILGDAMGEIHPKVETTAKCYRGADILVTPHVIATRVVREALACGLPIVAGEGSRYAKFTANPYNTEAFAKAIWNHWTYVGRTGQSIVKQDARTVAEQEFSPEAAGKAAKAMFEKVLAEEKQRWTPAGKLLRKTYPSYNDYVKEQVSKLDGGIPFLQKYDKEYGKELHERLKDLNRSLNFQLGKSALCLGARQGTEVKAFRDCGVFAIGVDLNPGKNNEYVLKGDFHHLDFPDGSFDITFCNCLDHVYRPNQFLEEAKRILSSHGFFIVELEGRKTKEDRYACLKWNDYGDVIALFAQHGFRVSRESSFKSLWFREQIIFQKGGA